MGLHVPPTEPQGNYRYDPTNLEQQGPARIFPYAGEDGVLRFILTKLRQNLLAQGRLSQPWSLLLQQFKQTDQFLEDGWFKLSTALADLEVFQSGWFNFTLPPNEQFDANFVRVRRDMGKALQAAKQAADPVNGSVDGATTRSRFYTALETQGRLRPLMEQIHARDGGLGDREFARQRLAGQNPMVLRRVQQERDQPAIQAWATQSYALSDGSPVDLPQAAVENRLFIASYELLQHLTPSDLQPGRYVGNPRALFYRTAQGLEPVLIEIEPGQVVTPATGADAWMRAKLWVQTADVTRHELIDHLCDTHLRMEAFAIATPRQLPATHPVYRLLRPHFRFLLAINVRGNKVLLGEDAAMERLLAPTREASIGLINRVYQTPFEFYALPNNIERRGIEPEVLPNFPYRDDALLLWGAIARYVTTYLQRYYPDDAAVEQDPYLQAWAAELGSPLDSRPHNEFPQAPAWLPQDVATQVGLHLERLPSYARVPDFPSMAAGQKLGRIMGLQQLIDVLTQVIFISGPQHAAVNFSQFDYVGYTPNAPLALYSHPDVSIPLDRFLPSPRQELCQMELTFALSGIRWGQLGSSDLIQFVDRGDRQALEQFQAELATIETTIANRNQQRLADTGIDYPYLLPSRIPNSINI